ncbi:MAG: lipopolysaccharide biosynthesis protein [Actinomycetota bacterium]
MTETSEIKRRSVRGGMITVGAQLVAVLTQLISVSVLARLLLPEEFGIMAMVLAVAAFAQIFRDLGLSAATIQRAELTTNQLTSLFWINIGAGTFLTTVVALASPLVAYLYDRPEVTLVTLAMSPMFLLGSIGAQPAALLSRQMNFGRLGISNISGPIVNLVVAVAMAVNDFGYWSLVAGSLAGITVKSLTALWLSGLKVRKPEGSDGVRSLLQFGGSVTIFDIVNYFGRNFDNMIIGRVSGAEALGLYSRAYQLLMFPILNLRGPINSVAFPAMSRLQENAREYRRYYRGVISVLALLSMPLTAFLLVNSEPVIRTVLGPDWIDAAPLYSILALVAFIQPCSSTIGLVCLSLGLGRRLVMTGLVGTIGSVIGFAIGVNWGPEGVAWAYAVTTYVMLVPIMAYTFKDTPLRVLDFFGAIRRPAIAAIICGVALALVVPSMDDLADLSLLAITAPAFGLLYLGLLLVQPGGASELQRLLRLMRNRP